MQNPLNSKQISDFRHDAFVHQQLDHFKKIALPYFTAESVLVDIGGGCGFFAHGVKQEFGLLTRVIDMDQMSVRTALSSGVEAEVGDALNPTRHGDEDVICFNLILHHLVSYSEQLTSDLQMQAITQWSRNKNIKIFVNEYIYESFIRNISGRFIYLITKSKVLSTIGRIAAFFMPSLKANTFGVGVRFRSHCEWLDLFERNGFRVIQTIKGKDENVSMPRRLLLIKAIRRDSFLLSPK